MSDDSVRFPYCNELRMPVIGLEAEFKVFVDGEEVIRAGPLGFLGVLPSVGEIREAVASKLTEEETGS